jgi:beta-glucuronidase
MLKPVSNRTREVTSLNGLWRFAVDDDRMERPWTTILPGRTECPVPSSYNDLFAANPIRDHVGAVWYQRLVRIPRGWDGQRIFIRIGAATHEAEVYLDDELVASHIGGYTPFEVDLPAKTRSGDGFRLTIKVSNILTNTSIPPGRISTDELGDSTQTYWHDFFQLFGLITRRLAVLLSP